MPLDPAVQALLALLGSLQLPAMHEGSPQAARHAIRRLTVTFGSPTLSWPSETSTT
jgi:hypothetical protein